MKKGSRAQATGSHVIWKGKPRTSLKNRSWAQGQVKPWRKRGRKVQSPSWAAGMTLESNKRHGDVVKNSFNGRHVFNNELMRVPFDEFLLTIWVFLAYEACARGASGSENRVFLRHHPSS